MTTSGNRSPSTLREALFQLALAKDVPDADLLDDFVRRYPEHAVELTDFAIEAAVDVLRRGSSHTEAATSPAVARAMDRFQKARIAVRAEKAHSPLDPVLSDNPFVGFDRGAYRALANKLNATTLFLNKLRDRLIEPMTIPVGFHRHIAQSLNIPVEIVLGHLAGQPQLNAQPQFFKSDGKPEIGPRQSFEEAVRSSGLTEEQQRYLLSL